MLGVVYYTLGNIDPKFRSQCDAIQLLLIATTPVIKQYGIDALLEPFMNDLEYLERVSLQLTTVNITNLIQFMLQCGLYASTQWVRAASFFLLFRMVVTSLQSKMHSYHLLEQLC